MIKTTLLVVTLLALAAGCGRNPVTGQRELSLVSTEQEIQMGAEAAPQFESEFGGLVQDSELQQYVNDVGQRVAGVSERPEMPYTFAALRSDVPNAFALPGGKIYITLGLLREMQSERELAAVLAHEVGHVAYRHNVQQLQRQMGAQVLAQLVGALAGGSSQQAAEAATQVVAGMANLKYSRENEYESDEIGIHYLAKANYNPYGMVDMLTALEQLSEREGGRFSEMFQTHPITSRRVERAREIVRDNYPDARPDAADGQADRFNRIRPLLGTAGRSPAR